MRTQALGDVVGRENRVFGRGGEAARAHHRDIHPRDRQDRSRTVRRGGNGVDALFAAHIAGALVVGQERREMRADCNRAYARAATAVRNAEGLVQIQMRNVAAELPRCRQPDHRVHVGAIHIDLAAMRMHDFTDFTHMRFEHAVRRRIGDHDRGKVSGVPVGLGFQVGQIDVAIAVASDHYHLHARHLRGCRVGAVRRCRDQADVAMRVTARSVIRADDQQARVFALRAGIRLQRHGRVAGTRDEHGFELRDHLAIAACLSVRRERVNVRKFRPRDRNHLRGRVELHGARAQRNHRAIQRQVFIGQAAQIAQHFVFRVVAIEYRMGQIRGCARERGRHEIGDAGIKPVDIG